MTVAGSSGVGFVVDASVVLAIVLGENRRPEAEALLRAATRAGIVVPTHWRLEVGNTLLTAERRNALASAERTAAVAFMEKLDVRVDNETQGRAWLETTVLAQRHRLTLYDAAYLELAVRLRVPLATFDAALARAAGVEGVAVA